MDRIEATTQRSFDEAERATREALADQGFAVLTEIDVAATLKAKLGVDIPRMKILGACNAQFAYEALKVDAAVSLVMPCNVVVEAHAGGGTKVSAVDPRSLIADPRFSKLADDAAARLAAAVHHVTAIASLDT